MKLGVLLLIFAVARHPCVALDLSDCNAALGMETGEITDEQIRSSSSFDKASVGPASSRIRTENAGGAWCPEPQITEETHEWLELDFGERARIVTSVETQGRYGAGNGLEFATHYILEYWRPTGAGSTWVRYANRKRNQIILGNSDTHTPVLRALDPPIVASKLRFVPYSTHPRTICMRVEAYGCHNSEGLIAYKMPQGSVRAEFDLRDKTYDGEQSASGMLAKGLGQLTDGRAGGESFEADIAGNGPGYEWVGWSNTTNGATLEILFQFDQVRNFSSVNLFMNNQWKNDVRVFRVARLSFSNNGKQYRRKPVVFSPVLTNIIEASHWIKIATPYEFGSFVKLQLTFASKWMMISEIQFESKILLSNETDLAEAQLAEKSYQGGLALDTLDESDEETGGLLHVAPLANVPGEYVALIIGVMIACLIICSIIVVVIMLRQRSKHAKKASFAPAGIGYVGFKTVQQPAAGERIAINMKDMQMTVIGSHDEGVKKNGSSLYIMDTERCTLQKIHPPPVLQLSEEIRFTLPPPPPFDYSDSGDGEYAEPSEIGGKCSSSTLPLLPTSRLPPKPPLSGSTSSKFVGSSPIKLSTHQQRGRASSSKSSTSCSSSTTSPPLRPSYTAISSATTGGGASTSMTDIESLHYASSDIATSSAAAPLLLPILLTDIPQVCRSTLVFKEKIGEGEFGEVHLCDASASSLPALPHNGLVAVKLLRHEANEEAKADFRKEMQILSKLHDANIVQLLGACTADEPWLMIVEYMPLGDLNEYLQRSAEHLTYAAMLKMATEIASGMKYLESLNFVHRDLATRNCLVGENYRIKIGDFGMCRSIYCCDYYKVHNGRYVLPVRWMAWESVLLGRFTPKSDVWSFGVLTWEIFTYGRIQPFHELSDEEIVENARRFANEASNTIIYLSRPLRCPKEIFDLLLECWQRNELDRPSFHEIHLFLQRKNLGFELAPKQC